MADAPITGQDFAGLPAKKIFELLDGVLYIDGTCHGGGAHARLLLDLIAHPPPQPEPQPSPRRLFARYRVTEVEPTGAIDGLEVVNGGDDAHPLIYRYLQCVPPGTAGGPIQVVLPLAADVDMRSAEQQDAALEAVSARR